MPAIAAVVLGGTSIVGGCGYLGTVMGVLVIALLQSMLSIVQMPEAGRQVIYGLVLIGTLLAYGRGKKNRVQSRIVYKPFGQRPAWRKGRDLRSVAKTSLRENR